MTRQLYLRWFPCSLALCILLLAGCEGAWNNPYRAGDGGQNELYSSFSARPKHLDPVRSYSSNEYSFIGQIYEPPLQYHYLKRPYTLIPLTSDSMPRVRYLDLLDDPLPADADPIDIAVTEYEIRIQPGIRYQPHPAFAREGEGGEYLYHSLTPAQIETLHTLDDFAQTGSRELVADDYVHQIKRLAFGRLHSPIGSLMQGHIVGLKELAGELDDAYRELRAQGRKGGYLDLREFDLEGVEVVDRYTYRIRVHGRYTQFIYWLAMPFFSPMPWEADRFYAQPGLKRRNISLDWYPVGTGPFMLAENNPNLRMTLVRNPNYHGERYPAEGMPGDAEAGLLSDAGQPLPFIDKAIYNLEKESIPYWSKFLQGYYDTSGVASDSFDQAVQFDMQGGVGLTEAMTEKGIELETSVRTSVYYVGFNMRDPVVGGLSPEKRKLRQALSIALDFEEYISIFTNGRGDAAHGILPAGIFGYRDGREGMNPYVYDWVDGRPRRKPISEAHRLLAEAGYPDGRDVETGEPLTLYFDTSSSGPDSKARMDWLRKQFKKLDIQLVIRATDYNRFQEKMRRGAGQIFWWGWNADYPDPENFFFLLYAGGCKVDTGGENAANYINPEFDELFVRMKNMPNGEQRQAIVDRMMKIIRRDAPWSWGYFPKGFSLHHGWYHNAKSNLMAKNSLKYKRIAPDERRQRREAWNPPVFWPVALIVALILLSLVPALAMYRRRERSAAV